MSLLLVALLLILPSLFLLLQRRSRRNLPPSPPRLPVIGNLHHLSLSTPLQLTLRSLAKQYGPLMHLSLGGVSTVVVSSPDVAEEIMKKNDVLFANRPPHDVARILFRGTPGMTFVPYSDHWKQVRKVCVTNLLGPKMVRSFHVVREEEAARLVSNVARLASSPAAAAVDMNAFLNSYILRAVYRILCGGHMTEPKREAAILELVGEGNFLLGSFHPLDCFPMLKWLNHFFGPYGLAKRSRDKWEVVLEDVINEHAQRSKSGGAESNPSFLDALIPSADELGFTKTDIKSLLIELTGAGVEPTFTILLWTVTELVLNQDKMKKLQGEVRQVARGKDMIVEDDLSKMSYLKAVIKEAMRLHPPLPLLIPKESTTDCQIAGYDIPRKTGVLVNAWAICRDSNNWEDPDEFRPERFLGNSMDYRGTDFQFTPFGAGRRICAGVNFAPPLIEIAVANLVHRFDLALADGVTREGIEKVGATGLTSTHKHRLDLKVELYSDC